MNVAAYLLATLFVLFVNIVASIAADSWTLWGKTELFSLETSGEKILINTVWDVAGTTKERSTFGNKALCESARKSTLAKFRAVQGVTDMPDKKTTIRVQGEIVVLTSQHKDGKGDSEQYIEMVCRNDDPPKGERQLKR